MKATALTILIMAAMSLRTAGQNVSPVTGTVVSDTLRTGDPTGALWRSAVVPGWGQAYNRQIYKTPVVIGVIGALIGFAVYNNNLFNEFNQAYLYGVYINENPHPFPDFEDSYNKYAAVSTSTLRSRRDNYRRNRNLLLIGTVLSYGLNILDAYVNGHLIGFDVGEDLSGGVGLGFDYAHVSVMLRF